MDQKDGVVGFPLSFLCLIAFDDLFMTASTVAQLNCRSGPHVGAEIKRIISGKTVCPTCVRPCGETCTAPWRGQRNSTSSGIRYLGKTSLRGSSLDGRFRATIRPARMHKRLPVIVVNPDEAAMATFAKLAGTGVQFFQASLRDYVAWLREQGQP